MNEQTALEPIVVSGEIVNAPLSDEERLEHNARIQRILDNMQHIASTSLEVWRDLQWICDNKTYREKYDTFNEFCREEIGKDNSTIYRYLKDAEIKEGLLLAAKDDDERLSIMGLKESNTRFIRTMPLEAQEAFWKIAYGVGTTVLPKKEDGSIEPTTGFLESVASSIDEIVTQGGLHLDGQFIEIDKAHAAATAAGIDEDSVKLALLSLGVTQEYWETIQRQKEHIKERSAKADMVAIKGIVEVKVDVNGSQYPIIVDSKGNEVDLNDFVLSFLNRHINLSLRAPLKD